jgi:3-hydroxyacyl-CoA dehydrogenase
VLLEKVQAKQLGKKTGQGIYRYENGKPVKGTPDPVSPELTKTLIAPTSTRRRRC